MALAVACATALSACGAGGPTAVGAHHRWRPLTLATDAPPPPLTLSLVFPAPAGGGGRPTVVVAQEARWSLQPIDDEVGFVTDVVPAAGRRIAVGAVGGDAVPVALDDTVRLRPALWIGDEEGRWRRLPLPAPADGPGWLVGIAVVGGAVVALGRTAGPEGDVYALRSDLTSTTWQAATVAGGPGLQVATVVVSGADGFLVAGRGPTWTSTDGAVWVERSDGGLTDGEVVQFGLVTGSAGVQLVTGPGSRDVAGDVEVLGVDGGSPVQVESSRALTAAGLDDEVMLVTAPFGAAAVVAGPNARLRLVTIAKDRTVETADLPVRAADVRSMTVLREPQPGDRTVVAMRRTDGTIRLAGIVDTGNR